MLRYPRGALGADLARAGVGLAVTGVPLVAMDLPVVPFVILGTLAALFAVFAVHAARRFPFGVEPDGTGLRVAPGDWRLEWESLEGMKLAHFSVRRDSAEGWMELTLVAGARRLRVDSRVEGFHDIVSHAAVAAGARDLELDPATRSNLESLGIAVPDTGERVVE